MPRKFKYLEAGCLQVNLMSSSAQINQLNILYSTILYFAFVKFSCICYVQQEEKTKNPRKRAHLDDYFKKGDQKATKILSKKAKTSDEGIPGIKTVDNSRQN